MEFRVIDDKKIFYSLRDEWNSLLEQSDSRSIFLTWEWLYNWWDVYGEEKELFIICGYEDSNLKVIFPLSKRKLKVFGLYEQIILEFLGTGEDEKDEVCSNFMEPIIHPENKIEIYIPLFSFLGEGISKEWDQLILSSVKAESDFVKTIMSFFNTKNYLVQINRSFTNGATIFDDGWDGFMRSLGQRTRKKIKRERRILESMNGFRYRFLENEDEFEEMFDTFVNLSLKRWNGRGAFSSEKFLKFQKNVCREFFKKGYLKLSLMEVNGRIVAGNLDYTYKDTIYGYQTAFDPEFNPKIGVGLLGMVYCIEEAIKEGFIRYDWYKLIPGDYKEHFITFTEDIVDLKITPKSVIPYSEIFLKKAKEAIKRYVNYK